MALTVLLLTVAWFLKPPTVRRSLENSGVRLNRWIPEPLSAFGQSSNTKGYFLITGVTRKDIISALKKAGFRTEVDLTNGVQMQGSVTTKFAISQFIRQNSWFPFLGMRRARLVTSKDWTRLYFDPDIN